MNDARQRRQGSRLPAGLKVDETRQEEDDDEAADCAGEADDGSDGRIEAGEGDADGDDDHVDAGDVKHLLLLAADQQQESLKKIEWLKKTSILL